MKIFLTGATGFVGSQLARRLLSAGHEVAVLVRAESRLDTLQPVLSQIGVHRYDGSYGSLAQAMHDAKPEAIIHLASLFLVQHKPEDVERLVRANIGFPAQLLEAASQSGVRHLINTGTFWQHYQNEAGNPANLYAASKQAFEALLAWYVEARGMKAITLKLFDIYGPGDTRPKLFHLLRDCARTGNSLKMSPGGQLLDLVFIDDVLDAYELALQRLSGVTGHECYAVSNPVRVSLRELVRTYAEVVGRPVDIEWGGLPYRPREVMEPWSDGTTLPGWQVRTGLEEGIRRMEQDDRASS